MLAHEHSPPTACRHTVSGTISLPSQGFFSPFPHGTGSLSVRREYLALRNGLRRFPQGFSCPAVLRCPLRVQIAFAYVAITLYGPSFQRASANDWIGNSTVADPTTPAAPNTRSSHPVIEPSSHLILLLLFRSPDARSPDHPISCKVQQVWAVPISLATTFGIAIAFFSSRY